MEVNSLVKWYQQVTQMLLTRSFRSMMYKALVAMTTSKSKEVFL